MEKKLFSDQLIIGGIGIVTGMLLMIILSYKTDDTPEKQLENLSLEDLQEKLKKCISQDSSESYLEACKIRDLIKLKTKC